jgi:hypothetical protein
MISLTTHQGPAGAANSPLAEAVRQDRSLSASRTTRVPRGRRTPHLRRRSGRTASSQQSCSAATFHQVVRRAPSFNQDTDGSKYLHGGVVTRWRAARRKVLTPRKQEIWHSLLSRPFNKDVARYRGPSWQPSTLKRFILAIIDKAVNQYPVSSSFHSELCLVSPYLGGPL